MAWQQKSRWLGGGVYRGLALPTQAREMRADGKIEEHREERWWAGLESGEETLAAIPL